MATGLSGGAQEESGDVTDDTDRLSRGGDAHVEGRLGGNGLYLEQRFVPAGVGVVVVRVDTTAVDGGGGEEEDTAIIEAGDHCGGGEQRDDGTAVPQPPTVDLHPPDNVGSILFPCGDASQAFQLGRVGRD